MCRPQLQISGATKQHKFRITRAHVRDMGATVNARFTTLQLFYNLLPFGTSGVGPNRQETAD